MPSRRFIICLSRVFLFLSISIHAVAQQWVRVSSAHFSVLTDGGHAKGHDIAARFEQMRAMFGQLLAREKVRMGQPLEIIAVSSPASYVQLAPPAGGIAAEVPGLFLTGEDRIYVLLNASDPDCWRAIEYPFGLYLLNYNYPPTPDWFDQGFAEYFASLNFTSSNTELGGDPEFPPSNQASTTGRRDETTKRGSLVQVLRNSQWLPLAEILEAKPGSLTSRPQDQARYRAQSWVLVNYLIKQNKLPETGAFFELVENRKLPPSQAVQQAYGMPIEQLDQSVKQYFQTLQASSAVRSPATPAGGSKVPGPGEGLPLPVASADVADSMKQVPAWEAQALIDELEVRIPERRDPAMERLEKLVADRHTETVAAHRALSWGYLEKQDIQGAFQELNSAVELNSSDSWTRMALALASYRSGEKGARVQGLANMMESLHIVLLEYPDYAEAYYLLGWAQLTGGGANAAVQTLRQAAQLNPRREDYKLRLAAAYMAAKKWDEAVALLDSLKSSESREIATAAKKDLHDIPFLRKFGIPPEEQEAAKQKATSGDDATEGQRDAEESEPKKPAKAATPPLDKRPIAFLKAKLMSVDCSHPPEAVLVVFQGRKTLRLHTADYDSLLVIGGEKFSCSWKDLPVNVNYRAGGKMDGDLVSLELR
jgi:tetratricopeptide (TPR) repeat protein